MAFKEVQNLDIAYDNKSYGNLIDPYEWNANFKKTEEISNLNAEKVNENFELLNSEDGASNIGAVPIEELGQTGDLPTTVSEQIVLMASKLAETASTDEVDMKLSDCIKDVSFNEGNGVFTITWYDGRTTNIDTSVEKVPASFDLVVVKDKAMLRITNVDGSSTETDLTSLFNIYTFYGDQVIEVDDDSYKVQVRLKNNSITLSHLSDEVRNYINSKLDETNASALSASNSADEAKNAVKEVTQTVASIEQLKVDVESLKTQTEKDKSDAHNSAVMSQSWAVGQTGERANENISNSKYFAGKSEEYMNRAEAAAKQAEEVSAGGDMYKSTYDKNGDGVVDKSDLSSDSEKLGGHSINYFATKESVDDLNTAIENKANQEELNSLAEEVENIAGLSENAVKFDPTGSADYVPLNADTLGGYTAEHFVAQVEGKKLSKNDYTDKDKALVGGISNRNHLVNPWFTINQRGQTEYTTKGYSADMWRIDDNALLTINDGYISLGSGTYWQQKFEPQALFGKTVTGSVLFADGTIKYGTVTLPSEFPTASTNYLFFADDGIHNTNCYIRCFNAGTWAFAGNTTGLSNIVACKLEVGTESTLHLDVPPNKAEALMECQRYFCRIYNQTTGSRLYFGTMIAGGNGSSTVLFTLPVSMRANVVVTSSSPNALAYSLNSAANAVNSTKIERNGIISPFNHVGVSIYGSFVISEKYNIFLNPSEYIDFSAEL